MSGITPLFTLLGADHMLEAIAKQITFAIAKASGNPSPIITGVHQWSIIDFEAGGIWSFKRTQQIIIFGWRPSVEDQHDHFFITVWADKDSRIKAELNHQHDDNDSTRFRMLGIHILEAISSCEVPASVRYELDRLFHPHSRKLCVDKVMVDADVDVNLPFVLESWPGEDKMYQGHALKNQNSEDEKLH